jgi:hypothetical protein
MLYVHQILAAKIFPLRRLILDAMVRIEMPRQLQPAALLSLLIQQEVEDCSTS